MSTELTLGRSVSNDGFAGAVAVRIRKEAAAVSRMLEGSMAARWNAAGLDSLAGFIEALPQSNQRLRSLALPSGRRGDTDNYNPGPDERQLLASVGATGYKPGQASELLDELVAAAMDGALALRDASEQSLHAQRERTRELERQLQEAREAGGLVLQEVEQIRQHSGEVAGQAEALKQENTSLGAVIDTLTERAQKAERELTVLKPKEEKQREELRELRPTLRERNRELKELRAQLEEREDLS